MEQLLLKINKQTGLLELNINVFTNVFAKAENNPVALVAILGASCASKWSTISELTKGLASMSSSAPDVELDLKFSSNSKSAGICIIDEPYIIQNDDTNLAVFVMFINGPFDSECSLSDTRIMMMLSVLLSSVVVINIEGELTSEIVEIFRQPLEFANLVQSQDSSVTPFQYLDIVISNCSTGGFGAGKKGGSKYLKEQLQENILEAQAEDLYSKLKNAFSKINCFLFPEDSTAKQIKKCFDTITKNQLNPKLFLGNQVNAKSYVYIFQEMVAIYNKSCIPRPKDLFKLSVALNIQVLIIEIFTQFLVIINDTSLSSEDVLVKAKESVIQKMEERKCFGKKKEFIDEFIKLVTEKLESRDESTSFIQSDEDETDEVDKMKPETNTDQHVKRFSDPTSAYVKENSCKIYEPHMNQMIATIRMEISKSVGINPDYNDLLNAVDIAANIAKMDFEDDLEEEGEDEQTKQILLQTWDEKVMELKNSFEIEFVVPSNENSCDQLLKYEQETIEMDNLSILSEMSSEFQYESDEATDQLSNNDHSENVDGVAIGIDLGTTYCCMSVVTETGVKIIPNAIGKNTTPSYLVFLQTGEYIIGESAKNRAIKPAETKLFNIKRIIGRSFNDKMLQADIKTFPYKVIDVENSPKIQVGNTTFYPEEVSAQLIKNLVTDAEKYLQQKVTKAVITVPAYFNDTQRKATVHAGELAGLKVLGIMTEPTAAAIAYNLDNSHITARHFLVFDLGGGTFDVALFKSVGGNIECLAIDGDTHLGGEDFDLKMVDYCVQHIKKEIGIDLYAKRNSSNKREQDKAYRKIKRIQTVCEKQKEDFCSAPETDISVDAIAGDCDLEITMTRRTFEELNKAHFEKTVEVVQRVLKYKELKPDQINDVILVGGSAKITKVQDLLKKFFGRANLNNTINPDEAVAYGAAVHAAALDAKGNCKGYVHGMETELMQQIVAMNVQDVTPIAYGIEMNDGGMSVIIPRSTKIPSTCTKMYATAYDYATSVGVEIFQGEHPIARQNIQVGKFEIDGIPRKKEGEESVKVDMTINDNGILVVTATIVSTKHTKTITVNSTKENAIEEKIFYVQEEMTRTRMTTHL